MDRLTPGYHASCSQIYCALVFVCEVWGAVLYGLVRGVPLSTSSFSQRLTYRISCLYVPYGFSCDTNFENMLVSIVKNKIKTE